MKKPTIATVVAGTVLATGLTGGAIALAGAGGDDGEGSVPPPPANRAVAAALAETGGGRANAVEPDSENGAVWEVEVTKPDGSQVDVRLDGNMQVVVVEPDTEDGAH
jgi:hypothetical protein